MRLRESSKRRRYKMTAITLTLIACVLLAMWENF